MADKKDFFAKNKEFLEFLEKLAKEMGLDDSNFLRDIRIGWVDCLTTEKTDWEKCTPQKRAYVRKTETFKAYQKQYRSNSKN